MSSLFWLLVIILILQRRQSPPSISMTPDRFWALVESQDRPVVLLTTRGLFGIQRCYAFPHQGLIFRTDAHKPEAPPGVTLVETGNSFGL